MQRHYIGRTETPLLKIFPEMPSRFELNIIAASTLKPFFSQPSIVFEGYSQKQLNEECFPETERFLLALRTLFYKRDNIA